MLISNRDEFFGRKAGITRWNDDDYILCPYDVPMSVDSHKFGTWCGINKAGNVATILNLKVDKTSHCEQSSVLNSRGKVPTAFLSSRDSRFKEWDSYAKFRSHYSGLSNTGDFNFFYGNCKESEYRIIDSLSNTFAVLQESDPARDNSYLVVSNEQFHPRKSQWKKVQLAKHHLHRLIEENSSTNQNDFIAKCFQVASISPCKSSEPHLVKSDDITKQSIFVPPLKVPSDLNLDTFPSVRFYGTRSQIVLLVDKDKTKVTLIERVIHNSEENIEMRSPEKPAEQVKFEFDLMT